MLGYVDLKKEYMYRELLHKYLLETKVLDIRKRKKHFSNALTYLTRVVNATDMASATHSIAMSLLHLMAAYPTGLNTRELLTKRNVVNYEYRVKKDISNKGVISVNKYAYREEVSVLEEYRSVLRRDDVTIEDVFALHKGLVREASMDLISSVAKYENHITQMHTSVGLSYDVVSNRLMALCVRLYNMQNDLHRGTVIEHYIRALKIFLDKDKDI